MRDGKAGLLWRCQRNCRYVANIISNNRGASSSSPLAPRPRSVLDWQMELASPNPSSHKLLGKLYQAIQSPFPRLQQKQVWIEAKDVGATLKFIKLNKVFTANRNERKVMLDVITYCLQRCLKDAKRRVSVKLDMDCERHGIVLSEAEKELQVSTHHDVKAWQDLISAKWLAQHRLQTIILSRRRPSIEDLQEALSIVQQGSDLGKNELNQLLNLIARLMPTPAEGEKKTRFLELAPISSELRLNVLDRKTIIKSIPSPSLETLLEEYKDEDLLPQDLVRVFENVWHRLCCLCSPDAVSYGTALLLESKLAPWRGLLRGSSDLFEPLRKVSIKLQRKKILDTSHVNQLMWATLRLDPLFQDANGVSQDVKWPDMGECIQLYQEMRSNAVQIEMEWERRQSGQPSRLLGSAQWVNRTCPLSGSLLQRHKGLPLNVIPDQITYELLIRGFAWRGEFQQAMSVYNEMTQSDVGTNQRLIKMRQNQVESSKEEQQSVLYSTTLATYDSFFRGFAKHSLPYRIPDGIAEYPDANGRAEGEEKQNDWNIYALMDLFESYLKLDPKVCRNALEYYRPQTVAKGKDAQDEEQIDKGDWFQDIDESILHLWDSILSLEVPDTHHQMTCPAPTTQQLFFMLTALRRASNDDAPWVLSQWQRVVDKYGNGNQSMDSRNCVHAISNDNGSGIINKEGWTGWKLNNRLVRILEHLQSKL